MKTLGKLLLIAMAIVAHVDIAAKSKPMTLEQTVSAHYVADSKVSPDGKYIAYTLVKPREAYKDKDGSHYVELHVINESGQSRPFITGDVSVSGIQWDPSSQHIYYLSKRNDDKFTGIYKIPVDGGESQPVIQFKNSIASFSINSAGDKLVFIAKAPKKDHIEKLKKKGFKAKVYEEDVHFNHAYRLDLNGKKAKPQKLDIDQHVLSVAFHPKRDHFLSRVAPTPLIDDNYTSSQYRVYNLKGVYTQSFKTEGKLGSAQWSPDGKYVAIIGAENENDPSSGRLVLAHVASGKLKEILPNYMGHVRDIQWRSNYQLTYLGDVGTQTEVKTINVDSNQIDPVMLPGKLAVLGFHADQSGKKLVAVANSFEHPSEVVSLALGEPKRLTDSNPWLSKVSLPKQESITYKARDGLELGGVLVYPLNYKKNKRYPLIMSVHGGPEANVRDGWVDRYSSPTKYAAANGYAVFFPNYRGSTGRGVEFSKMGQADYAGAEFNDLVDAIDHLVDMGLVDRKRVGITGGSYGGYASAWGATALSEHFAASVMFVGISNQLSKFGTTDIPKEMYNVHARNYPWDKWQWMLERSPIYHTDKAKTPILIMHGENDTRVHPSQSMELYRYIKTRTETPVRLVLYPGEGHGNRKVAAQLDYSKRLMRWMDFYLKGKKKKGKAMPPYDLAHEKHLEKKKEEK